jgi:urea transporter
MTMAFIMSVAILFLGNPHVFPTTLQKAQILSIPVLAIPVITLLFVLLYWLFKILLPKRKKKENLDGLSGQPQ